MVAGEPGEFSPNLLDRLVGQAGGFSVGGRGDGSRIDLAQDLEQQLGGAEIGLGGFVDELLDHEIALGELAPLAVLGQLSPRERPLRRTRASARGMAQL